MNKNPNSGEDPALRKVLREWTVDAPLPPRFHEGVWQRLARADRRAAPAGWTGLWRLIEVALPRPKFAFAYLSAVLALGVAAGSWAAQAKTSRLDSELSLRYVQLIDPYRADTAQP